jgi:hypothetical protein
MRLNKKIARVKFKNGRSHQGLLTYLDDTDAGRFEAAPSARQLFFSLLRW